MNRIYVKFDGTNTVRFNWPNDPVSEWTMYESKYPIRTAHEAMCLIEWIFDYSGYVDVIYSMDWEIIVIEEDHDN